MHCPCASRVLPVEFRSAADNLFPPDGFHEGKGPSLEAAEAFAEALGVGGDYKQFWKARTSGQSIEGFLNSFQNNLDLLIQKTWVEKGDEVRKENLEDRVPPFITLIEKGEYAEALREFGAILDELAYLFFGDQRQKSDFAEYVLRIDPLFGLFWWYEGQINGGQPWIHSVNGDVLFALLLLGICYLTDF